MAITERKYYDLDRNVAVVGLGTDWTNTGVNPTSQGSLFAPVLGSSSFTRLGKQVNVCKIQIRGEVSLNPISTIVFPSSGRYGVSIRLILVQDMQTNASIFLPANVINSGSTIVPIHMFQNPDNWGRYRVLKDQTWTLYYPMAIYDTTAVAYTGMSKAFHWTVTFNPPLRVRFNGVNNGTIGDIVDNSFNLMAGCDAPTLTCQLAYKSRVIFVDP